MNNADINRKATDGSRKAELERQRQQEEDKRIATLNRGRNRRSI